MSVSPDVDREGVADGSVDIAIVADPEAASDVIGWITLAARPNALLVSARHPLATQRQLSRATLVDEIFLRPIGASTGWTARWTPAAISGIQPRWGPRYGDFETGFEMVAANLGVMIAPMWLCEHYRRADVRYILLTDVDPTQVVLVWRPDSQSATVSAAIAIARELADAGTLWDPRPARPR